MAIEAVIYCAGFFDGEGCVTINKQAKQLRNGRYQLHIARVDAANEEAYMTIRELKAVA